MTVGIRIKFAGLSREEFDEVNKHVDPAGIPQRGFCSTHLARSTVAGCDRLFGVSCGL
jgi:hypothetical protein